MFGVKRIPVGGRPFDGKKRRARGLCSVVGASVLVCSLGGSVGGGPAADAAVPAQAEPVRQTEPARQAVADGAGPSRVFVPSSVTEMTEKSHLVVIGTPVSESRTEMVHGVPFTVRDVVVESQVKGPRVSRVTVREFGDGRLETSLVPGQKAVLFLSPFEFTRGRATGQWVVTGQHSGFYRVEADMAYRVDPEATGLPARIAVAELVERAGSSV